MARSASETARWRRGQPRRHQRQTTASAPPLATPAGTAAAPTCATASHASVFDTEVDGDAGRRRGVVIVGSVGGQTKTEPILKRQTIGNGQHKTTASV